MQRFFILIIFFFKLKRARETIGCLPFFRLRVILDAAALDHKYRQNMVIGHLKENRTAYLF